MQRKSYPVPRLQFGKCRERDFSFLCLPQHELDCSNQTPDTSVYNKTGAGLVPKPDKYPDNTYEINDCIKMLLIPSQTP